MVKGNISNQNLNDLLTKVNANKNNFERPEIELETTLSGSSHFKRKHNLLTEPVFINE